MSDTAYQRAVRRRDELKKELSEIEEFLRLYKKFAADDTKNLSEAERAARLRALRSQPDSTPTPSRRVNPPREEVGRIARGIMLERGKPQTRSELVEAFKAHGSPIQGADPSKNMGTLMWRMSDKFVNIDGHGYWPRDVACPEYGYTPDGEAKAPTDTPTGLGRTYSTD